MGRDQQLPQMVSDCIMFQPTRPYGARQVVKIGNYYNNSFNPRAPMGRDALAKGRFA